MAERLSRDRLATRSGVEPGYLDRLVALGILRAADDGSFPGSAHRIVRLARTFEDSGITPGHIGEAIRGGQLSLAFMAEPGYDRFSGLSDATFREVSERSGVPVKVLMLVREATGYSTAAPEDRMRDDELEVVPLLRLTLEHRSVGRFNLGPPAGRQRRRARSSGAGRRDHRSASRPPGAATPYLMSPPSWRSSPGR